MVVNKIISLFFIIIHPSYKNFKLKITPNALLAITAAHMAAGKAKITITVAGRIKILCLHLIILLEIK